MFPLPRSNLETEQSPAIFYLSLTKTRSGKSRDYGDVIVFEKLRFRKVFRLDENENPVFSNSAGLKSSKFLKSFCSSDRLDKCGR